MWKHVTEELPPKEQDVLLWDDEQGMMVAWYDGRDGYVWSSRQDIVVSPICWHTIPEGWEAPALGLKNNDVFKYNHHNKPKGLVDRILNKFIKIIDVITEE